MANVYVPLLEWLDDNSHRKFPLDDSASGTDTTGAQTLPTSLITDLFLCVPTSADITKFFLSSVLIGRYFVNIEISYAKPDTSEIVVCRFTNIPTSQANNSVYYAEPADQALTADLPFTKLTGALVIGRCTEALAMPGYYAFTKIAGLLLASRISQGLAVLQQITVGSRIYTGNIVLKEGTNVKMTPVYDAGTDTTTITIDASIASPADLPRPLVDDASVLYNLTVLYGRPIHTINSIPPGANYDFQIRGLDCTLDAALPTGAGITFANSACKPCCDKSMLDAAYAAIAELNKRYSRMESYYENIGRNVNELQARMVALEIP